MGKRGAPPLLDRLALHEFLWARSDSRHRIVINQRDLAHDLAVSHDVVSEALIAMTKEGLVEECERRLDKGVKQYVIKAPSGAVQKLSQRRVPAWG